MIDGKKLVGGDRVTIDKDVRDIYKQLTEQSNKKPEIAPFFVLKDVFMLAVAAGFQTGRKKPLSNREQIFMWYQLSQDIDIPTLRAIAIADSGDVEIIAHEDQILSIAEEYANEGIHELKANILGKDIYPLWSLVEYIRGNSYA